MMVGLFGSGKTTTSGKLAKYFLKRGKKVCLVGLDVHRPAAMDQITQVGKSINVPVFVDTTTKDPVQIWKKHSKEYDKFDVVLVPVGGGGLMSGIAGFLKSINKSIQCIGCLPKNSPVMYESVKAGRIVDIKSLPTLSDATAGGIESGAITFDICRENVDHFMLISEQEIAASIKLILAHHFMLIEGGAALPVAALLKSKKRYEGKTVILIITGKKITLEQLKAII